MAVSSTQLLRVIQQFRRSYDRHFSELLSRTGLSMREMHVVLFLANHPAHDTARDVTELRGLAKSQVSAAVDLLAAREGQKLQSTCLDALFAGLTQSEAECFQELLEKVLTSAEVRLKEGGNT